MTDDRLLRGFVPRIAGAGILVLLTASCWWLWMDWDHGYHVDPATGVSSGPYQAWQVIGCAVCLIALGIAATQRLPAWLVIVIMPLAFTTAWSVTAAAEDTTGLWAVGAVMIFLGVLGGTIVTALGGAALRRLTRAGDRPR
ncbi:hypothetical protein [Pseudonocardia sp. H11422]|uniref:hypothetical protein n=1 Tax=Pseudonocardia sp. H11422 TaxID=2835866 RepID=UPI001BDC674A|nr:hypothetical protein [Pseudonocardia sp. H11422]